MSDTYFCPQCFASSADGSWGHVVIGEHCTNCGNPNTIIVPEWSIKAIRQQASWVGKRYYPHEEDQEHIDERKRFLAMVESFPDRTAAYRETCWWVTQKLPNGGSISCMVDDAHDEASAIEASRYSSLPYMG